MPSRRLAASLLTSGLRGRVAERHDLNGRIAHFLEEAVQRRSFQQDLPARSGGLPEDDVGDALAFGKRDQAVGGTIGFDAYDRRAELFGERMSCPSRRSVASSIIGSGWSLASACSPDGRIGSVTSQS